MSNPRLIMKTHGTFSRPGYFSIIIQKCCHPYQSAYPETIAKRLVDELPAYYGKRRNEKMKPSTAVNGVKMAYHLGFLTDKFFWSWKGHTINALLNRLKKPTFESFMKLEMVEKIAYLKYFLEQDGALLLRFSQNLLKAGKLRKSELMEMVNDVFIDIWESYLDITNDLRERVRLRDNIRRIRYKGFDRGTLSHKLLPRIEPLEDFGLVKHQEVNNDPVYSPIQVNDKIPLQILVKALRSISEMEKRFKRDEYFQIIANVLCPGYGLFDQDRYIPLLEHEIIKTYLLSRDNVAHIAPINTIIDTVYSKLLAYGIFITPEQIRDYLDKLHREKPSEVQFHVDRQGRRAFVVFSNSIVETIECSTKSN